MGEQGHLYFHSPCFDGIASAVLVSDFLETARGMAPLVLHPVDYDLRAGWLALELGAPAAVVDFLYHPRAAFWADHHATAFLNDEARADFDRRSGPAVIYDGAADSCAGLLWRHLEQAFGHRDARYADLVGWAEKIDAARYGSVEEAIFGSAPALRLALGLALGDGAGHCVRLVRALREHTLDEVGELADVRQRFEEGRALHHAGLERFKRGAVLDEDDIVTFDVDGDGVIVSRYAPYYFHPAARYSIGIVRSRGGAKITAMRNPWREFASVPLGRILEAVGGGGHHRVGAVALPPERVAEARAVLVRVLAEVRRRQEALDRGEG